MYLCRLFLFIYFCILRHYDLFSGEANERIECNKDGAQLTVLCAVVSIGSWSSAVLLIHFDWNQLPSRDLSLMHSEDKTAYIQFLILQLPFIMIETNVTSYSYVSPTYFCSQMIPLSNL